jgi:hypothetical protein
VEPAPSVVTAIVQGGDAVLRLLADEHRRKEDRGRDQHRDQGDLDARDERVAQRLGLEERLVPPQAEALEVL